jgi:hypothetical protein
MNTYFFCATFWEDFVYVFDFITMLTLLVGLVFGFWFLYKAYKILNGTNDYELAARELQKIESLREETQAHNTETLIAIKKEIADLKQFFITNHGKDP